MRTGSGNHRGSIFRLIVGTALIADRGYVCPTWDDKRGTATIDTRAAEMPLEIEVSRVIRRMPFLWLAIENDHDAHNLRGYIERSSIALLSNYDKPPLDPPSTNWLGRHCNRERVLKSGLWNQNHVEEEYDPRFLDQLESLVGAMELTR
jgi:hypothetical protein